MKSKRRNIANTNYTALKRLNSKIKNKTKKYTLFIIVATVIVSLIIWNSKEMAKAIYDFAAVIIPALCGGLFGGLFTLLKKCSRISTLLMVMTLSVIFIFAQACIAKENESESEVSPQPPVTPGTETIEKEYLSFSWEEDPYIVAWTSYCDITDEEEAVITLIESYTKRYLYDDSGLMYKSEDELNEGIFGQYIAAAAPAEEAIDMQIISEAKKDYIDVAIGWREKADDEYELYTNKKILGDLYLKKADLPLDETYGNVNLLQSALKYYIEALPLAYLWLDNDDNTIQSIWASIRDTYIRLGKAGDAIDKGHKERIPLLIGVCDKWCDF